MSPKADEYRLKATVAEALSESDRDQDAKETYLEIAERWRRLAEQAEKNKLLRTISEAASQR